MKKKIVFLLTLLLTLTLAGTALANIEDQMKDMVQTYLDENGQDYVYDDYVFTLKLAIGSVLEYADVGIFIYDDMLAVIADAPVQVSEENFEKMAVFTTLANNEIFYGQFRVDREYGYICCRSCNLVEDVIPGENELFYLVACRWSIWKPMATASCPSARAEILTRRSTPALRRRMNKPAKRKHR